MLLEKIKEQLAGSSPSEIEHLILENCSASSLDGPEWSEYDKLSILSLAHNSLQSLKGFPALKSLTELNLSHNGLETGLNFLANCISLKRLDLTSNKINQVDQLDSLKQCKNLESLTLKGCPLVEAENYVNAVFDLIPSLKTVDGISKDSENTVNGKSHTNGARKKHHVNGEAESDVCAAGDSARPTEYGIEELQKEDLEDDDTEYVLGDEDADEEDEDDDDDADEEAIDAEDSPSKDSHDARGRGTKRKHEDADPIVSANVVDEDSAPSAQ